MNQRITFLSYGGGTVQDLQLYIPMCLSVLSQIEALIDNFEETYPKVKQLAKAMEEFQAFIERKQRSVGEATVTSFVESTVNAVINKRFGKRQPMQWTKCAAHLLLQTRVRTLNRELERGVRRSYPDLPVRQDTARAA
jgi:hypothetical protein